MSAVLGAKQNLGIFQDDLPAIVAAMSREGGNSRTQVDKYIVLDLKDDPPFPSQGSVKIIYYCISKPLGTGEFAVHVALRSDRSDTFQKEKRVLSILKEAKGVLQPLCIQTVGDFEYMISELFNRGDLTSFFMDREFTGETLDTHWIGYSLARAVSECHEKEIVLRDLKPADILIRQLDDKSLEIKLIDFGSSFIMNEDDSTEANEICGSLIYFPPEELNFYNQTGSAFPIHYSRDMWVVGFILFTLVNQELPVDVIPAGPGERKKILYRTEPKSTLGIYDREIRDLLYLTRNGRPTAQLIQKRIGEIFRITYPNDKRNQRPNNEVIYYKPRPIFDTPKRYEWKEEIDKTDQDYRALGDSSDGDDADNGIPMENLGRNLQQNEPKPRGLLFRLCCCFR